MNTKKKFVWIVIAVIALAIMLFALWMTRISHTHQLARHLAEVDFQELLTVCRQLQARTEEGTLPAGSYWVRLNRQPQLPDVPDPIRKVDPLYVRVAREGYVELEMGGIPFWGFVAYATDRREDYPFQGDVEIIPGLWYYDEDYEVYPRFKDKVDALIQEAKTRQNRPVEDHPAELW